MCNALVQLLMNCRANWTCETCWILILGVMLGHELIFHPGKHAQHMQLSFFYNIHVNYIQKYGLDDETQSQ
jgi:hypothetical protein